jgi:cell division protein FtsB
MSWTFSSEQKSAVVKRFLIGIGSFVVVWVLFFDTHSVYSRIQMSREHAHLEKTNKQLEIRIAELEEELARPLTDEEVERLGREVYGMVREGEKSYPVIEEDE